LRARERASSTILWIEQEAGETLPGVLALLGEAGVPHQVLEGPEASLPPAGTGGVVPVEGNLGYGGGNNVGLRMLARHGVPYAWVLNNDTLLEQGSSADLVRAAQARPEVGAWGACVRSAGGRVLCGGGLRAEDFSVEALADPVQVEQHPRAWVTGCALFGRTEVLQQVGFVPEDYFLYYEDVALSLELQRRGWLISACPAVSVFHEGSLSTGRGSPLVAYYTARNRWVLLERYFPEALAGQQRRGWYRLQSLLFRLHVRRARLEWAAWRDWKARRMGRSARAWVRARPGP
ncbi:MAG: glycosyltransferase family 2 protein, partial [Planctomycetia bacterium]